MKIIRSILLVGAVAVCTVAQAEVTFEVMGLGGATDVSADGSVVVGNTYGDYETFRWTEETGMVPLGLATVPVLGGGAGTPDVSADGTKVSATILGMDSTYGTQGLWTLGVGWQELMPPAPPDGGILGSFYGSAWGLSYDGGTVVGYYQYHPGEPDGAARASYWTAATGVVGIGTAGVQGRANDANEDGTVVVGWVASPVGVWQPTVWVDGAMTILNETPILSEASVANPAGTILAGQTYSDSLSHRVATVWRWNGSGWDEDVLGAVAGTFANYGTVYPHDMTPDGSMIVGYNAFDWSQSTGFIWTEETGMVDVEDYLSDNGITVPTSYNIRSLTGMSDDGTVMIGCGSETFPPYYGKWFIIRSTATGIAEEPDTPEEAEVVSGVHAHPNPMRGRTTLSFTLPRPQDVSMTVYDISGRLVAEVENGHREAGLQEIVWDGRDANGAEVASGIYLCRLDAGEHHVTGKVTILR
jgi:uncharacterized membrane protein